MAASNALSHGLVAEAVVIAHGVSHVKHASPNEKPVDNKIGIYLNDIAAAFDRIRIFKQNMLARCRRAGASDCVPTFLSELFNASTNICDC